MSLPDDVAILRDVVREHGVGLVVKTPMVEARLDTRGFVITDPLLASRAGLLVGDRILQVNDVPIDGIGSLLRAYRAVKDNPTIRTVDVLIERNERPLSLAYRVR
jgi:membrane-associated protease RseP (regulator of RpoE activity)